MAGANGIMSNDFREEKAVTPHYYLGSGYEFFMNESNGSDILKYSGAQKMSRTSFLAKPT